MVIESHRGLRSPPRIDIVPACNCAVPNLPHGNSQLAAALASLNPMDNSNRISAFSLCPFSDTIMVAEVVRGATHKLLELAPLSNTPSSIAGKACSNWKLRSMLEEWVEHKSQLVRSFTASGLLSHEGSTFHTEFKSFLAKYERKVLTARKSTGSSHRKREPQWIGYDEDADIARNSSSVPTGPYNKYHSIDLRLSEQSTDKFSLREVPTSAIHQFEHVVALFYKFRNARRFKKLKTLKKCQESLPIAASRSEILDAVEKNQVLIIAGDTGCGKSTQLPQFLLHAGYTKIACTQPRRIACTALARRVAVETLKQFDSEIAFQTRFDRTKTPKTKMLFLTEGVLLRQLSSREDGGDLSQYNCVILDEVHERSTSIDLLIALLRELCYRRADLKLILMSATINIELFTAYFPDAPLIQVPGRLYPIDLHYMPVPQKEEASSSSSRRSVKIDPGPYLKILQIIDKKCPSSERGDVLIFLNGISEISMVADALKEYAEFSKKWIILILHSTLSMEEQNKVFDMAPLGVRKCVLSTNIAETSVTIDEIRFVVDSGKENLMRYESAARTHRLTESWISKASAEQRKGRAGRTGPGICYRLYSQEEYEKMEDFTLPEIKRVSLDTLVMQILDMSLQVDVRDFPFLERPDRRALNETIESLKSQGVVDGRDEKLLTPLGTILARLPVDVAIGKMLIYACVLDQVDVALTIAAGLSVQSPFTNRSYRDNDCVQNRQHLLSDMGDPFTLVKVYREWLKRRQEGEDTRRWTMRCGIEEARLYEITKLRRQFREILAQSDLIPRPSNDEWASMSSQERRIKLGEKRQLRELKKRTGYEERRSKVLKEGRHFDSIMEPEAIDGEGTDAKKGIQQPQDDINSLEFSLAVDARSIQRELTSHKLNSTTAAVVKMILAAGLYPQYAMVEPTNNFRVGHDQFAHTLAKPFVVLHPNSALGQVPEVLRLDVDKGGRCAFHQLVYYGLLLETTKPYLCNSARIPDVFLLITARNVTSTNPCVLSCDGFVELSFDDAHACSKMLEKAVRIKEKLLQSIDKKLKLDDYGSYRELEKSIVRFAQLEYPFAIRRMVDPPKELPCGVFDESGEEHHLVKREDSEAMLMEIVQVGEATKDEDLDMELDEKKIDDVKMKGREYYCQRCQRSLWFSSNVEIIKHNKSHGDYYFSTVFIHCPISPFAWSTFFKMVPLPGFPRSVAQ